ncbi:MAG TPA: hypothetical protein VGO07_01135 [Candidatus Saccharimonadales bacterium]|jgi:uncharacterized protein with FMN-binding domain|nr:hypothetical protein [Candidatus Saccharimonadales bacterium]
MDDRISSNNRKAIAAVTVLVVVVVLVMGAEALTGKRPGTVSTGNAGTATTVVPASASTTVPDNRPAATSTASAYKDGNYTATGAYDTPDGTEMITVSVTLSGGTIEAANVSQQPISRDAREYQDAFASGYKIYVVGKDITTIQLSRVSGSSLTPQGFNDALEQIKTKAQS